jgi:hypothetical protein
MMFCGAAVSPPYLFDVLQCCNVLKPLDVLRRCSVPAAHLLFCGATVSLRGYLMSCGVALALLRLIDVQRRCIVSAVATCCSLLHRLMFCSAAMSQHHLMLRSTAACPCCPFDVLRQCSVPAPVA